MTPEEEQAKEEARKKSIEHGHEPGPAMEQSKKYKRQVYEKEQAGKKTAGEIESTAEQAHSSVVKESQEKDIQKAKDEGRIYDPAHPEKAQERRHQEGEAALNRGETGGPVAEINRRSEMATAQELGHIPGPEMEARKEEEKGIRMAHDAGIKKSEDEEIKQARTEGRIVTGHGPEAGRSAQQAAQRSEEIQSKAKQERESSTTNLREDMKSYPEADMWARGTTKLHTEHEKRKLDKQIGEDRLEGKIITGRGIAAGRAAQQDRQAAEDHAKSESERLQSEIKQSRLQEEIITDPGLDRGRAAQQEQQAREEGGRATSKLSDQQTAETRRDEIERRDTQARPVIPVSPPTDLLGSPKLPTDTPASAGRWNRAVNIIGEGYISPAQEESMGQGDYSPHGRIVNRAPTRGFLHPWLIQPFYDTELELTSADKAATGRSKGMWCANVLPGFVNGQAPAIGMRRGYLPVGKALNVYGNGYGQKQIDDNEAAVQVLLTDSFKPFIKFSNFADSRAKVIDANGVVNNGVVPLFFRVQGAFKPEQLDESDIANNVIIAASMSDTLAFQILNNQVPSFNLDNINKSDGLPEGTRYLYRADIVLQVDRPALKQNFEFDSIGLLRLTGFDINLPLRNLYSARLYTIPIWIMPKEPTIDEVESGAFNDRNFDEVVIGTAYFLSPTASLMPSTVDANGNTQILPPDGTWMAWVEHQVYWNLNYCAITQIDPVKIDTSLDFFTQILSALAGGAGYLIALSYVNPLEAQYNQIETALNQSIVRGAFWTG